MQMQLNDLGRGFSQPALCSQSVFRHVLAALSLPASLQVLDPAAALQLKEEQVWVNGKPGSVCPVSGRWCP